MIFNKDIDYTVNPLHTAAFTGHRDINVSGTIVDDGRTRNGRLPELLRATVRTLYGRGFRVFLSGMAPGFDLLAAEAVLSLRSELSRLQLVAVVPFAGFGKSDNPDFRYRYGKILAAADHVHFLYHEYYERCCLDRNDLMLGYSSVVVSWWDGRPGGGTEYTVRHALEAGKEVIRLCLHENDTVPEGTEYGELWDEIITYMEAETA